MDARSLAWSPDGTSLLVVDAGHRVVRCFAEGEVRDVFDGKNWTARRGFGRGERVDTDMLPGMAGVSQLMAPTSAAPHRGQLLVVDEGSPEILSLDAQGRTSEFASGFSDPWDIAVADDGAVFVSEHAGHGVSVVEDGRARALCGRGREGFKNGVGEDAAFRFPKGIALSPDGSLYVADAGNNAIRKVLRDGTVSSFAGGLGRGYEDGLCHIARFSDPHAIAVAADGVVYVADTENHCVRAIADGLVTTLAGGRRLKTIDGDAATACFQYPCGLLLDEAARTLYVSEFHTVRAVSVESSSDRLAKRRIPLCLLYALARKHPERVALRPVTVRRIKGYDKQVERRAKRDERTRAGLGVMFLRGLPEGPFSSILRFLF